MAVKDYITGFGKGTLSAGWGTLKGMGGDGWKGFRGSAILSIVAGVAVGIATGGLGYGLPILLGLVTTAGVGAVTVPAATGIGVANGMIFGGNRQLKKDGQAKNAEVEAKTAGAEVRLQNAQMQNQQLRAAMYQMDNQMAAGKASDHFTSQHGQRANAPLVGAGRGAQ